MTNVGENKALAEGGQIFVLDIGTRSVVGIAGHMEGDLFMVEDWAMEPHPRRAMIDGQIEDIEQVARVAGLVKARIEEELGVTFTHVGVAAAGRALETVRAAARVELPASAVISQAVQYSLENAAVNDARLRLDAGAPYYCVGHSVVQYRLDGYPFATMVGHKASVAEVEIIATFLPAEVVESLRRCMELLELEVDTLTLEPIAAMRAVIPRDLRLLNLALVDIGAGTSDIALSAEGSVGGYTMATVAGDEITEAIIRKYLVDFATAEGLKMAFSGEGPFRYTDILGFEHELGREEVLASVGQAVENLATVISGKILDCNAGAAPAAVFLVGGGSRTPGLPAEVAKRIGLEQDRVAIAGTQFSGKVLSEGSGLDGPEFATPVGIALVSADNAELEGAAVSINGKRVKLFSPGSFSVMDALLAGGYTYAELMGRNGRPLTFSLNGKRTVVRGGYYTAAELSVNAKPASLATPVENGDAIDIVPAANGQDAAAAIADYAPGQKTLTVSLNGRRLLAGLIARVNGGVAAPADAIQEQDEVELYLVRTAGELCAAAGLSGPLTLNGAEAGPEAELQDGDEIVCPGEAEAPEAPRPEPAPPAAAEEPPAPQPAARAQALPLAAPAPGLLKPEAPAGPEAESSADAAARPETPPEIRPRAIPVEAFAAGTSAPEAPATPEPEAAAAPEAASPPEAPAVPGPEAPAAPGPEAPAAPGPEAPAAPEPEAPAAPEPEAPEAAAAPAPKAPAPPPEARPSRLSIPKFVPPPPQPEAPPAPAGRRLHVQLNGKDLLLEPKPGGDPHLLFDLLPLADIDPQKPSGMVRVRVNGQEAPYLEELVSGDKVEIGWEK